MAASTGFSPDERHALVAALTTFFAERPEVEVAVIFGSVARGQDRADSDVDVLVIGDASELKINAQLRPLARQIGRPINASVYDRAHYQQLLAAGEPFLVDLLRHPVIALKGALTPCIPPRAC